MHTVAATRTVDAPVEEVWNAIDDVGNVSRFHPKVERSERTGDVAAGAGATRRCEFYGGGAIREEVLESVRNERQVVAIVDSGPFPLTEAVGRFDLEPVGRHRTAVTMRISFVPTYGPVGWLMAKLVMERQFRGMVTDVLAGLDTHLQTGETVGPDGEPVTATGTAGGATA